MSSDAPLPSAGSDPRTVEHEDRVDRVSPSQTGDSRRQFLGMLGAVTVASGGVGTVSAQQPPTVSMASNQFGPVGLHVDPGTTVRFELAEGSHSATAYEDRIPAAATPFDSGVISDGAFEYTFDVPGTYDYYCLPHKSMGMVGRIVVGTPGGPAEARPIPNGAVPDSERIVEQGTVRSDVFDDANGDGCGRMGEKRSAMMDEDRQAMGEDRSAMMNGTGPGWMFLMPISVITGVLAVVSGVINWASNSGPD